MCIRPVTMPARASLGRKNEAREECVHEANRQAPQWGPTPGAVIKSRVRALPFASLRTCSSKPFSSLSRTACTAEEHTTSPLSFCFPSQDLTNDSPRGAELPFTRAAYGMRRSMQICHVLLAIYARLRLPIAGEGIPHTGRRECSLNPRRDDQQLPSSYLWMASLVH